MKYFFIFFSLSLLSLTGWSQNDYNYDESVDPLLDESIREKPETEDYQNKVEQERQEQREEFNSQDPLREFEEPRWDTGNGATTNQKMKWPEP